jgi:hypothetical protein
MKKKVLPVIFLIIVTLMMGKVLPASAGAIHTPVHAWEIPLCQPYGGGHPDCTLGEWTFPGGNMHVRNMVQVYQAIGIGDDRLTGTNTLIANANWDENGYGPGWGTFHNQSANYNGYWEGTWSAVMSADGYISYITGTGYGAFAGMKIRAVEVNGFFDGIILELP